jgi:RHS repeat-associated protein
MPIFRQVIASFFVFLTFISFSGLPVRAAINYTYDPAGNLISGGSTCYIYNQANQLSQVKNCGSNTLIAEYIYDHAGNRLVKKEYENGILKQTIYSPDDHYQTKKLANGTTENTTYYYANDELLARKNPDGSKVFYYNDHLGSTSVTTDSSGALVEETAYDPYGEIRTGGLQSKFQYTGQEKDLETGLNYYGARYYDPHTRRFTQPDTLLPDPYDPQQLNRYAYARGNPLKYTDPSGHFIETALDVTFLAMDFNDIRNDPTNAWNYMALAADIGGTMLPGATGGRVLVKTLEHGSDATKIGEMSHKAIREGLLRGDKAAFEAFEKLPSFQQKMLNGQVTEELIRAVEGLPKGERVTAQLGSKSVTTILDTGRRAGEIKAVERQGLTQQILAGFNKMKNTANGYTLYVFEKTILSTNLQNFIESNKSKFHKEFIQGVLKLI